MKTPVFFSCITILVLIVFTAAPVLAAALSSSVICPPSCACLLPGEAAKINTPGLCGGKQILCGTEGKNEKHCYEKPKETTAAMPLVIFTGYHALTTAPTTVPILMTRLHVITPAQQVTAVPVAGTTRTAVLAACGAGCSCLPAEKADAAGLERCSGTSAPCGTGPSGRPKYCYVLSPVNPVVPVSGGSSPALPAPDGSLPPIERKSTTPVPSDSAPPDLFASIGTFFSALFGESKTQATAGPVNSLVRGCSPGQTSCDSNCTDTSSDRSNCGRCGIRCYSTEQCCNGVCTSIYSNGENCGGCSRTCPAGSLCTIYACHDSACREGLTTCSGACVDTRTDLRNCGSCGHVCPSGQHCIGGDCYGCGVGSTACGAQPGPSCLNLQTDRDNCGSCRNACGTNEICRNGSCVPCPAGTTSCILFNMSSACADLRTSEDNCGSCRNACWFYGDNMTCVNGQCGSPTTVIGQAMMSRGGAS